MKLRVVAGAVAQQDGIRIARRLAIEAGPRTADRFFAALDRAFAQVASSPLIDARLETDNPSFQAIRCFSLSARFKKYLLFYQVTDEQVDVIRVLHGAQDLDSILADLVDGDEDDEPEV